MSNLGFELNLERALNGFSLDDPSREPTNVGPYEVPMPPVIERHCDVTATSVLCFQDGELVVSISVETLQQMIAVVHDWLSFRSSHPRAAA